MKNTIGILFALCWVGACAASCADTASCSPGEVFVESLCVPVPPEATGGAATGGTGMAGAGIAGAGAAGSDAGLSGEGGAP